MAKKVYDFYLTELILSIHNEVQSAMDYISEVAAKEETELGKSSAAMGLQNVRVKMPFEVVIDQQTSTYPGTIDDDRPKSIKSNLASRKGFAIDIGDPKKRALFTKLKIQALPQPDVTAAEKAEIDDASPVKAMAEIELTFSPYKRD